MSHHSPETAVSDETETPVSERRVVAAGMIGSVIEYFDFLVYATVSSLVFGKLFFPEADELVATLLALSTFAVGYVMRPLGGIVFGIIGDRFGRRRVLFSTLVTMGIATACIGLLPTYATIGIAAPIILLLLRIVQGLAVGGEYGGAQLMVVEHAEGSGRRGFLGSLVTASVGAGFLLASGLLALLTGVLSDEQFTSWGWRIPFLVSFVLLAVGFYIRLRISETPVMKELLAEERAVRNPLFEVLRRYPKQVLLTIAVPAGAFATYNILLVFSVPFARSAGGSPTALLTVLSVTQVVFLVAIIGAGRLSDRIGRRIPMIVGAAGIAVWMFAFFPLLESGTGGAFVAFTVAFVFLGGIYGPLGTYLSELFGTETRLTGFSLGYQISGAIFGGLTPLIAVSLSGTGKAWLPVAVYIAAIAVVTLVASAAGRETADADLTAR
jgi:MFS family permease